MCLALVLEERQLRRCSNLHNSASAFIHTSDSSNRSNGGLPNIVIVISTFSVIKHVKRPLRMEISRLNKSEPSLLNAKNFTALRASASVDRRF
jgi:hypothetical protein